ncbi:MAG: diguanylate cyclase [Actinobacteria bacterium]|nr:diguanylate cyclase [Actinomycetota bacterium]
MDSVGERADTTWLHVADVARLLGVSANTVRRWTDAGRIAAYRSPGGHRRYLADDVHALLSEEEIAGAAAHPGDFAELRRQTQDLRAFVQAGLELTALLTQNPRDVPELVARRLCELTDTSRCDVFVRQGDRLRLAVSIDGGELDESRIGDSWALDDWLPESGAPDTLSAAAFTTNGSRQGQRTRRALQRRGCRSLVWAPLTVRGDFIGAVEVSDARARDLGPQVAVVAGLARICAHAVDLEATYRTLEHRDRAIRDLMDLSQEVAQTPELDTFVERFALRLMNAVNADCVDLYRVGGGVIRLLLDLTREGVDRSNYDRILDTSKYPSLERTLIDHTPLVIDSLADPRLSPEEVERYREWGYASSLTMPLVAGGTIVGLADLYDDAERDWELEVEYLTGVTQLVAGLFENAVLLDEVETRSRLQHELVELAARLASAGSQQEIALEAARKLREVSGADDCDVWWLEEGYLRCLASMDSKGMDEAVRGKSLDLALFPSTAHCLEDREVLVFTSLADPRITDFEREDWGAYDFRSMISLPLIAGDEVVGMIDVFDIVERDFNDVRGFLTSAARTIADALQNAHLMGSLRQSNAALRELVELGDRFSEAEGLQALSRIVAGRLRAILEAEDCDIWGIEGGRLKCLASIDSRGWDADEVGSERDLAVYDATLAALAANEPMVIGDLEAASLTGEEMASYRRWGYRSMVSLPLVVEGRPIGLIDVFDTKVRDYTSMLDLIRNVGRLLAGAFEKAMLVERLESGNRDLRLLVDSGLEFGATLDVDAVLGTVAERIVTVAEADICDVYGLEGDDVEILAALDAEAESSVGRRYRVADFSTFVEAAATHRPVVHLDVQNDPDVLEGDREDARRWGYRSIMTIPLLAGGEMIGFVEICNREKRPFARPDVIVGLAQVAGQAVANARLYRELDESVRWMTLMSESALELAGSLDLRDTLLATAKRLCDSVGVPECEITVIEGDGLRTLMRIARGHVDEEWIGQYLPLADAAVTREVIATKRPTVVGSLRDQRLTEKVREINQDSAQKSWATLPLIVKDRVIGTVELVESGAERTFTQAELDTAAAICHAAAMAIENAALFEREQAANQETLLLNQIARRTAATLDLEEVAQAAADELRKLLPFDSHSLLLAAEGRIERVISPDAHAAFLAGLTGDDLGEKFLGELRERRVMVLRLPQDVPLPADHPALAGLRSAVAIALPSERGILGAFNLVSSAPDAFGDVDVDLLERVATQLSLAIKNAQLYEEIKQMHLGNLKALSSALNAKDYYTLGHAARVAAYTVMLGRRLGWEEDLLTSLEEAAYLHDIGKISISDRVLLKPGRLNPQEWQQMKLHPVFSADIIRPLFPEALVAGVRHHHEHYDGHGYPDGLSGDDIPLLARAMAVVDAYDAMSCRRPYKAALTYPECLAELQRCRGTQFEPLMVDAFLEVLEELARTRTRAEDIAVQAASRIPGDKHLALRSREDEDTPEYREIREILREVRDANPPTRFLTTHAEVDKKFVIGVDPEEKESERSHVGDEIFADDELPEVLAGRRPPVNTLFADEFGVWVTGLAPIRDAAGRIVAAVAADLPALSRAESEALRGGDRQTFAAMLQTAAVRLGRAEIDAITDGLTGLYNHRYLHERLSEELHRARELGRPLTALFCDLDHFKGYNDANGHSAGDAVLREVSHLIEQSVRNVDIAARYGGEEFVVLLVETGREAALAVAERIRERIRAAGFTAHGTPLTVSIGIAGYPEDAERREELLDKADWAMYLAKRRGRDQVATFAEG